MLATADGEQCVDRRPVVQLPSGLRSSRRRRVMIYAYFKNISENRRGPAGSKSTGAMGYVKGYTDWGPRTKAKKEQEWALVSKRLTRQVSVVK